MGMTAGAAINPVKNERLSIFQCLPYTHDRITQPIILDVIDHHIGLVPLRERPIPEENEVIPCHFLRLLVDIMRSGMWKGHRGGDDCTTALSVFDTRPVERRRREPIRFEIPLRRRTPPEKIQNQNYNDYE